MVTFSMVCVLIVNHIVFLMADNVDTVCPICLETIDPATIFTTTRCGHMYHDSCLNTWLRVNYKCPVCRHSLLIDTALPIHVQESQALLQANADDNNGYVMRLRQLYARHRTPAIWFCIVIILCCIILTLSIILELHTPTTKAFYNSMATTATLSPQYVHQCKHPSHPIASRAHMPSICNPIKTR